MSIFPGTGLPRNETEVAPVCILVCGESPRDVFTTAHEYLRDWSAESVTEGFREFSFQTWSYGSNRFNLFTAGLGSASVELALQEGALYGIKKFILTGSCASLRKSLVPGSVVVPQSVVLRPGAFSEYSEGAPIVAVKSDFHERLKQFLSASGVRFQEVRNISTDAFYGIGASLNSSGRAQYGGAPLKAGREPSGLALALENPFDADTLDMEAATFFSLGQEIEGIEVAALKIVSNPLPWSDDFDASSIENSARVAVRLALDFVQGVLK